MLLQWLGYSGTQWSSGWRGVARLSIIVASKQYGIEVKQPWKERRKRRGKLIMVRSFNGNLTEN